MLLLRLEYFDVIKVSRSQVSKMRRKSSYCKQEEDGLQ